MKSIFVFVCLFILAGCQSRPKRPNYYPAQDYPFCQIYDLQSVASLKYEGWGVTLDGGSHAFCFSTPQKQKIYLYDLCYVVKEQGGFDLNSNAFMIQAGFDRSHEYLVAVGSDVEKLLVSKIIRSSIIPVEIVQGLKDRRHEIQIHELVKVGEGK